MNATLLERVQREHPERILAVVREWNGGKWGRTGEYVAIVKPEYFKNGKMKTGTFGIDKIVEQTKTGYRSNGANHSESIADILYIL